MRLPRWNDRISNPRPLQRRGTILTWFAVFLFALLPLMTLIVHLGMVTLTRRQMQTAVNTAALEGLRSRDTLSEDDSRMQVHDLVKAAFDDDLNPDNGDNLRLGAGPVIAFDDEPSDISLPGTNFKASRRIRPENIDVYEPFLELNKDDQRHGDMVRGQYKNPASHSESNSYLRADFLLDGDPNFDTDTGNDAFLVRLRRTGTTQSLDDEDSISSSGRTIPFLFGRGPYGGADFLNQRERGTIVRATAIAHEQPAFRAGVGNEELGLLGLLNVQMDMNSWMAGSNLDVGNNFATEAQLFALSELRTTTVGESPFENDVSSGPSLSGTDGYVILTDGTVEDIDGNEVRRIIGFGIASGVALNGTQLSFVRQIPQPVGSQNVSSSVRPPENGDWNDLNLSELFAKVREHADSEGILLAPALVRSIE